MFHLDEKHKMLVKAITFSGCLIVLVYFLLANTGFWISSFNKFVSVLFPFFSGFALAILFLPAVEHFESKFKKHTKWKKKYISLCSVSIVFICIVLFVSLLASLIIPSLIDSIVQFSSSFSANINQDPGENIPLLQFIDPSHINFITTNAGGLIAQLLNNLKDFIPSLFAYSLLFVSRLFGFVVGLAVMVYGLMDKDRLTRQFRLIAYACLPEKFVDDAIEIVKFSLSIFNRFVVGKLIDSLIIGVICYIGMSIFGMEYALLISTIVGITNMIPVFGPFIGAVPGMVILLVVNPMQALFFALWILALQQFDGNILGPYILGDKVGLPSIWVIFAIVVGGGLGGFLGMFLGIPIFAVIYALIKKWANRKVAQKQLTHKVEGTE